VPAALAAVHGCVHEGNTALESGDHQGALGAAASVRAMLDVLGVDPLDEHWEPNSAGGAREHALSVLVGSALEQRQEARAGRDFVAADAVRDLLATAGIDVTDTPDGPQWTVNGEDGAP